MAFINKALSKHSHVHLLTWYPRLLWPHNSRADGRDRKSTVLEAENTYYLACYRRSLLPSALYNSIWCAYLFSHVFMYNEHEMLCKENF